MNAEKSETDQSSVEAAAAAQDAQQVIRSEPPIIFFDGVCGMCNRFVNIVIKADKKQVFRYAPLQGETAKAMLPPLGDDPREWSMLYVDERGMYDQSDASLEVYRRLGGFWRVLSWAQIVPSYLRTPVYRFIARHRYKVMGKKDVCRIPSEEERALFLD